MTRRARKKTKVRPSPRAKASRLALNLPSRDPEFLRRRWHYSDSGRFGCAVPVDDMRRKTAMLAMAESRMTHVETRIIAMKDH